jgi:phosphate transport system substrate-binding protein
MRSIISSSFKAVACLGIALSTLTLSAQGIVQARATVAPSVPSYVPAQAITEEIKFGGSDAVADTVVEWDRIFRTFHPQSRISFNPQLSNDAIRDFIGGKSTITISAREMTAEEAAAFQAKNGYAPTRIPLCIDAVIVFVNKGNPINEISLDQLDGIYSTTRLTGTKNPGDTWGDLGERGDWKTRPITAYSREEGAATRSWFANTVLRKGKFKASVKSETDAMALAEAVVTDPTGIAFGPLQAWYASVKVIPVAPQSGQTAQPPTQEAVYAGKYPLARVFQLFVNKAPGKPLSPAFLELTRFLLSREGQNVLADTGYIPAPADFLMMGSKRLN